MTTELVYLLLILELKNRHGHWLCWMSTCRKNGLWWRTQINTVDIQPNQRWMSTVCVFWTLNRPSSTGCAGCRRVCVIFILNRSSYPSTSSTTTVRADSSILLIGEIQVMWSYKNTPQRNYNTWYCLGMQQAQSRQWNAMLSCWRQQAQHTHSMK